jgi:hypothetical protein
MAHLIAHTLDLLAQILDVFAQKADAQFGVAVTRRLNARL